MTANHTHLNSVYIGPVRKLTESGLLIALVAGFSILATTSGLGVMTLNLTVSILIILAFIGSLFLTWIKRQPTLRNLLAILAGLGLGLWIFCVLRYLGQVDWPYQGAVSVGQYGWFLYYHFILAVTILAPLLIVIQFYPIEARFSWGRWNMGRQNSMIGFLFMFLLVCVWIWPVYLILNLKPAASGPFIGFLSIALFKALINGFLEEYCYRGLIQNNAMLRYGVVGGILVQAGLYTAFHLGLGEVFASKALFLVSVMALGVILGTISHLTRGIGWAALAHVGIDLAVEWRNLS